MSQRVVWAYSKLKTYELCPRKYEAQYVTKSLPYVEGEEQKYGNRFHEAAQKALETDGVLPDEFGYAAETLAAVQRIRGDRYAELKLGADIHLSPTGFFDGNVWVRGVVDFLIVDREKRVAYIGDWKTGKDRYPDKEQLILMSLLVFLKFEVDIIKAALVFVVKGTMFTATIKREDSLRYWQDYRERVARLQGAHDSNVFNPTQNFTCKKWCGVTTCEFYGR
jgi:hypothetical protein